jgi:hypothetical protein
MSVINPMLAAASLIATIRPAANAAAAVSRMMGTVEWSQKAADENGQTAQKAGGPHAARTDAIRIGAIGDGDIEGADARHQSGAGIASDRAGRQRQRNGNGIPERHPRLNLVGFEAKETSPECRPPSSHWPLL